MNGKNKIQLDNAVLIGDIHFGVKSFSLDVLRDQIKVFRNEIIPFMEENNIKNIIQLGDIFNNRTTANIIWFETIKREFFNLLRDKNIDLYTLKGNHDIAYRESLDIALIDTISDIYSNVTVFSEKETIVINNQKVLIVPWLTRGQTISKDELDTDYIFGHLEIRDFEVVPGHKDTTSTLTEDYFKTSSRLKGIYSGHYHIKNTKGMVKYLGSLTQLTWSDYKNFTGFYFFDGINLDFYPNNTTKKHIKIHYNSNNDKGTVCIKGLQQMDLYLSEEEFKSKDIQDKLKNSIIKTYIEKSKDSSHDEVLQVMKDNCINTSIINNQELNEILEIDYSTEDTEDTKGYKSTKDLITEVLENNNKDLVPLLNSLIQEIGETSENNI